MGLQRPQEGVIAHYQQDLLGRKRAVIFPPSLDLVTAVTCGSSGPDLSTLHLKQTINFGSNGNAELFGQCQFRWLQLDFG